ncbi:hypothetical protein DFP73DRAFT_524264 [Morchella snyderi]|nr:hypothetical protein DFP73DRAFT_524264 [Morchella snyderi]
MLAPSPSFSTLVQGFLLLSTLFATAHATNIWATAPNTAVFYCGEDGKGKPTGTKAMMWAIKGAKTSMYAKGRPEYQSMKTVLMVQQTNGATKIGAAESKLFAEGASGVVRVFEDKLNASGMSGVWKMDEEPALIKNTKVTALHVLNPDEPEMEYIVWERKGGKIVYKDEKYKVTGLPISRLEDFDLVWQPPTPPGSPKVGSPRAGSPKAGSPRAASPAPARAASPKAAPPKAAPPKAAPPKAGSPSRSSSKSPTRSTGRKVRRSRQF